MDTYPSSEHVSKALSRRDELRYEEARTLDTIEGYLQFIQSSPEATQVSEAKLRIEALAFADAQKKHTKESYQQFIENYPEAIQVEEARKLLFIKTHYDQDYLMGRFHPSVHPFFAPVDEQYLSYNKNLYLHSEAYDAFVKMHEAAKADGIDLVIISATRTFYYQKEIWMRKWSGMSLDPYEKTKAIMVYNSMPGLSRHHWGTDIDLNALHESYFETDRGIKVYQWLVENAPKFGYYQPYTALGVNRFTGYTEEKWHWSYMPVAKICLKEYLHEVGYDDINDFEGAEHAPIFRVIEEYVMGIDKSLWE